MICCRTATRDEVHLALDWAADEGWNPGLDDAAAFYAADPEGFFVATEEGQPVAVISVVNHTQDFAFLGLYIVRPNHRGRGIGLALWEHAMRHAGSRTVGLDGVPDQQANYVRSGFVLTGQTTRFEGEMPAQIASDLRPAGPEDFAALVALEAAASGISKAAYVSAWVAQTASRRTFVETGEDGINGVVTLRKCRNGVKIGPLIARDTGQAEKMMRHAAAQFDGPLVIDVPESAPELAALCTRRGFVPSFGTARMYRGEAPTAGSGIYAVTTLELG